MGLDFSHGSARWAYSGFHRFRIRLAKEIGMDLDEMAGFREGGISWEKFDDAILPLLNHSDCDGELSPEECQSIAPRLRELVANWEECIDKKQALELASSMDEAFDLLEPLEFR